MREAQLLKVIFYCWLSRIRVYKKVSWPLLWQKLSRTCFRELLLYINFDYYYYQYRNKEKVSFSFLSLRNYLKFPLSLGKDYLPHYSVDEFEGDGNRWGSTWWRFSFLLTLWIGKEEKPSQWEKKTHLNMVDKMKILKGKCVAEFTHIHMWKAK